MIRSHATPIATAAALLALMGPPLLPAQEAPLAALLAEARTSNPAIRATEAAARAAETRVPQAGALPDPTLAIGLMWVPIPSLSLTRDMMTMGSVDLMQRIPARGTRGQREAIAIEAHGAALRELEEVELRVLTRLKASYYDLYFAERALAVLDRHQTLLVAFAGIARSRYALGRAPQQDVLRAQTEISRLDDEIASLRGLRTGALAEVNELLSRPSTSPVRTSLPEDVRALVISPPPEPAFTVASLDRGIGGGFPSLEELQAAAVRRRPMLLAHEHRIAEQREGVLLAERERSPDLMLQLGYQPRFDGRSGLVTAMVSVDLPVFAGRKQSQAVMEARHLLASFESGHHEMVNEILGKVARRYAALLRSREGVLLLAEAVVPQAKASVESASAAYRVGEVEFLSLLDAQAALFRHEIELERHLADFGRELAGLERAVGFEPTWEEGR